MPEDVCSVCSAPASNRCSACKQVSYCSREHQKQDWCNHRNSCRPFEVRTSQELGKYLVASRDLSPGDMIISEGPLVVGPKLHNDQPLCLGCHAPTRYDSEYRCPKCLWPCCGPSCPADPKVHAPECAILCLQAKQKLVAAARNKVAVYHYDAVTPLRCLLLQRRNPRKWEQILQMEAHLRHRGPGTDAYREVRDRVVSYLQDNYLQKLSTGSKEGETVLQDCSENTLHRICGILDVNGLDIRLTLGSEVVALYPTVYLMEHNCLPNTRHSFEISPGEKLYRVTVTASRPILKGEHLATMYTHALWGTQARREHLAATKYFSCRCERCSDPTELGTYISGLRCLGAHILTPELDGSSCGGTQLPVSPLDENSEWHCDRCPVVLTSSEAYDLVSWIGEEVDNVQADWMFWIENLHEGCLYAYNHMPRNSGTSGSPTVTQLEELLSKLSTFLHPHHYHLYSIKHSLVQLFGHQQGYQINQLSDQQLERKADMCRDLLAITDTVDPGASRLALYSSVILHELYCAEFLLARRDFERQPPVVPAEETSPRVLQSRALLLRGIKILEPEPQFSSGSKMLELLQKSLSECDAWMKAKGLSIPA